jgi:hypothetical protein
VSGASQSLGRFNPASIDGATRRFLLVVDDPRSLTDAAVNAGGELASGVTEEHGWLLGRVVKPLAMSGRSESLSTLGRRQRDQRSSGQALLG